MITNYDELPIYLTVEEYGEAVRVGRNTAYNMVRSGIVPSLRLGAQYRIPKEALRIPVSEILKDWKIQKNPHN